MSTITITPTGGADDYSEIQNTIKGLSSGDTIQLNGDFITKNTIEIRSNMIWRLNGSLKLADNSNVLLMSDKGATKVTMSGGVYDGNGEKQKRSSTSNHCIRFENVTYSTFTDMIVQHANNDNFTLSTGCNNNTCTRIVGKDAVGGGKNKDGNGLDDKGDHNTWIDCIAEGNSSDNWVVKCNSSIFRNCIGRNSKLSVGFGFFSDANHEKSNGNRFENCLAYGNAHAGFSMTNSAGGKELKNNFIQVECYDNGFGEDTTDGHHCGFRMNNYPGSMDISGNTIDVLIYNNKDQGFYLQADRIHNNSGSIVAFDNKIDVDLDKGSDNTFVVYHPTDKSNPKINKGSNAVTVTDFTCPAKDLDVWAVKKYCGTSSALASIIVSPTSASVGIGSTIQLTATCKDQNNVVINCPAMTWNTSNNAIAAVDITGKVMGVATGMANINTVSGTITSNISTITVSIPVGKNFSINDITQNNSKIGVLVVLDDTGAFTKEQACIEVCNRLGQI